VRKATTLLFVLIGLSLAWSLFLLLGAVMVALDEGPSPGLFGLALAMVAVDVLFLFLTWRVRQGSRPAWVTMLVILGLQVLLGLFVTLASLSTGDAAGGLILLLPPAIAMLLLAGPRSSRRYFLAR
jgi:hypothetical protein